MQLRLIADMPLLHSQHTLYVLVAQLHAVHTGPQLRSLEHILNLMPIQLVPRQLIEVFVTKVVDPAIGRRIEGIVPDEEEDPFVGFQEAEEVEDDLVPLQVVQAGLFEEEGGFVKDEDGAPLARHL